MPDELNKRSGVGAQPIVRLTKAALAEAVETMLNRLRAVENLYVQRVAEQIRKIGELGQTNINRLVVMYEMARDIGEVKRQLQLATQTNNEQLSRILQNALDDTYTDPRFRAAIEERPLTPIQRAHIEGLAQNIAAQTQGAMTNLSNTTAITPGYHDAVDKAITATVTGLDSYTETMRQVVQEIGYNGLQVQYESGYHRRLDTAARQNIIDAVRQIQMQGSLAVGEALGYDAVELSAHLRSAPDHEPVQGRVFLLGEFAKMQAGQDCTDIDGNHYEGFRRPIGEWNCMHFPSAFSTRYNKRRWDDAQLNEWKAANKAGCKIGDKHFTTYEASQYLRQLETRVRREKDAANALRAVGDEDGRKACQIKINALMRQYYAAANAAGIRPSPERTTVEGFKAVKVKNESAD